MNYPKIEANVYNAGEENPKTFLEVVSKYFPDVIKDGNVDFDALKEAMGIIDNPEGEEKYELTWAGKQESKREYLKEVLGKTLRFKPEDSLNADTTENLYIEGDNLEVMKLLKRNYRGKIKMIYIDPPYNKDKDFVYNDKFKYSKEELAKVSNNTDKEGNPLQKNTKGDSYYHSKWLNMMFPRLKVARELLTEDGVIFISIDDNEVDNLKKLCNEIFGESNFVAQLTTVMNLKGNNDEFGFAGTHEYSLVFIKNKETVLDLNGVPLTDEDIAEYKLSDQTGRYKKGATLMRTGEAGAREKRPKGYYPIYVSKDLKSINIERQSVDDYEIYPKTVDGKEMSWRRSPDFLMKTRNEFIITKTNNGISFNKKQRLEDDLKRGKKAKTLFYKPEYSSGNGTELIKYLFNDRIFDNPKPLALIKDMLSIGSTTYIDPDEENEETINQDAIVLDFFSGSATTAHAVMQLNAEDGGNRKFIMVQLQEKCKENSPEKKAGYENICEIGKERIRRAIKEIHEENPNAKFDDGFKCFEVADTNIKWIYDEVRQRPLSALRATSPNSKALGEDLKMRPQEVGGAGSQRLTEGVFSYKEDNARSDKDRIDFMPGFTDLDVVYELMLRQYGIPLSTKIDKLSDISDRTFIFADTCVVCLDDNITDAIVTKLAEIEPVPAVYVLRDSAFGDDIALKDYTYRKLTAMIQGNLSKDELNNRFNNFKVEFI